MVSCAWLILGTLITWPNFLSYFNEIAGGPDNGWRYLRDSNIDWGQDLPLLKEYMNKKGIKEIKLAYFGEGMPEQYAIKHKGIFGKEKKMPKDDIYAVSVNSLDSIEWTKQHKPVAKAGCSIFIYDLR
jgi:hypothetical protein